MQINILYTNIWFLLLSRSVPYTADSVVLKAAQHKRSNAPRDQLRLRPAQSGWARARAARGRARRPIHVYGARPSAVQHMNAPRPRRIDWLIARAAVPPRSPARPRATPRGLTCDPSAPSMDCPRWPVPRRHTSAPHVSNGAQPRFLASASHPTARADN